MSPQKTAVVAMSGGVDSSVAALILKEEGYHVIGISMKLWDYPDLDDRTNTKTCCAAEDIADARSVASRIGIPFYAVNYTDTFKEKVITPFVNDYIEGRTPNPCVLCNMHIKFDYLLARTAAFGADLLVTGHYARIDQDENGRYRLLKGLDPEKDQSYFLYDLGQDELARLRFPLGHMKKSEVREIALSHGLCTAAKKDSQEICFVSSGSHADFIRKWKQDALPSASLPPRGNFINQAGESLGEHEGIYAYTVGQRRGLNVGGNSERHYVTHIDPTSNTVTLGTYEESLVSTFTVNRVHWVDTPESGSAEIKIRYRQQPLKATLTALSDTKIKVTLDIPERAVAPGQSAVFYRGDQVLGGGWIDR